MLSSKCIYFGILMVHYGYAGVTTLEPPTIISAIVDPEFVHMSGASVKPLDQTNTSSAVESSGETNDSKKPVKDLSMVDMTALKKHDGGPMFQSSVYLPSDSPNLSSISEIQRPVRAAKKKQVNNTNNSFTDCVKTIFDWLSREWHIPCYQYCGPGTNFKQRVKKGLKGINPLDAACKKHDMVYDRTTDKKQRLKADKELLEFARKIHDNTSNNGLYRGVAGSIVLAMERNLKNKS